MSTLPNPAVGAARQYAALLLGGPITEDDSNPTIQTTATVAIDGNGDRVGLAMINVGANPVYVSLDPNVGATNGILLAANGGSISMNVTQDFTIMTRRWWAIATGGTSSLYVLEIFRVSL